ncbi:MAG: ATP-binding protein [Methanoculleaceae archaeon]
MNLHDIDPADTSKFRLIGQSVLSYRFAVPMDSEIYLGDVLKITDEKKGMTFFAKVTDILHESNFSDPKWDTRPHTDFFYRLGDDVYLIAEATPLGYLDGAGVFNRPKTLPTKFSRVTYPDARDLRFLSDVMGDIEVGTMRTGNGILSGVNVSVHSRDLSQHMGVFATTGMGKSNFMKVFCASCMKERRFGLLVVDPHGEYVAGQRRGGTGEESLGLVHLRAYRDGLSVFTIRDGAFRRRYRFERLYLDYDDFRTPDLALLYENTPAQQEVLDILEEESGSEVIDFFTKTEFDNFDADRYSGPHPHIAKLVSTSHNSTLNVIKRRIMGLLGGTKHFFRRKGSSIRDILNELSRNRVVLIDIPGMGSQGELFVLSLITRRILQKHQEAEQEGREDGDEGRQVLIAVDEAQRVLGERGMSTRVFRECAMEGRKFGVGLCVVTQQPKNIDPRILAQINTFVVMGLADRGDRKIVESSAKQDLSMMDSEIQTLGVGEAIISSISIPFPVSTKIHRFEDYIESLEKGAARVLPEESVNMKF